MQFHINYNHPVQSDLIDHSHQLFLIGSCFADNIGTKLKQFKLKTTLNPNGILFNPISIATAIESYIQNSKITEEDIVFNNGLFHSINHHGCFSNPNVNELINTINESVECAHNDLKQCDYLFITFGSSNVYVSNHTNSVVANCHKLPQSNFTKEQLQPGEIINHFHQLIDQLKSFNPKLKIIFTVSPVKYLRDGLVENNLSKAVLIFSIHEIIKQHTNCHYFPAYELVTDDLRDYRFYKEDLAHPNELAIEYVWDKFVASHFTENAKSVMQKLNDINKAVSHRPIHGNTEAHILFKKNYLEKCAVLEKEIPGLNLEQEKNSFQTNH